MKKEVKKLPKGQVEIVIEVPVEELGPYLQKAAEKIAGQIKIDGFRPGKAPFDLIKSKVGEMEILREAADAIISQTYYKALEQEKIITVGQPEIAIEKMAPGNPFVYKATAAILPAVKIGDWQKIELKRQPVEIKSEKVEQLIADIQKMRAKENLVQREAKLGDRLEIDFDVYLDKVPIENGSQKKYPITLGEGRFIPGFEEQLVGLKAGEQKEFELKFPEEYYQKNLAGKACVFKVNVSGVYEVELPKADDEFAKAISGGQFKTVAEMEDSIRKNLEQEEKNKQEQRLEIEMLEKIIEISEFEEIPDVLTHNETHKMLHELEDSVAQQGFDFGEYLKSISKSTEDLEQEFAPQADKRVKTAIVCREIYQQEKMEIRPDEVEAEIEETLKRYPANPEVKQQLESDTYRDYLKNILGNRKVIEFLKAKTIKD